MRIYGRNFWVLVGIGAVWQVPVAVFGGGLTARGARLLFNLRGQAAHQTVVDAGRSLPHLVWPLPLAALATLAVLVAFFLDVGALVHATATAYRGGQPTILEAYRASWRKVGWLVVLSLLTVAVLLLSLLALICSAVLVGLLFRILFGNPGWLVEIAAIPAALWGTALVWTRVQLATPALMVDGDLPAASLRRSWGLVKGRGLHVFGALLLLSVVLGVGSSLLDLSLVASGNFTGGWGRVAVYDLVALVVDLACSRSSWSD